MNDSTAAKAAHPPYMAVRLAPVPMEPLKGSSNSSLFWPMPKRLSSKDIFSAFSKDLYASLDEKRRAHAKLR